MRNLLILGLTVLALTPVAAHAAGPNVCTPWTQVNDGAFGMPSNFDKYGNPIIPPPTNPHTSEEGFEVLVFGDRLYVGMEADNSLGARLWRTQPAGVAPDGQADWEEVIANGAGCPFGNCQRQENPPVGSGTFLLQNDHIDSLAAFDDHIYASTANGGGTTQGTQVWRSPSGDPSTWTQVNTDGFGDIQNTNFKDMQGFDGWLCGGTQNWVTGAQVWCTADGTTWAQKNHGGFGVDGDDNTTVEVWSGYVYGDALYFGAQSSSNAARLFRTTDLAGAPTWTEVYTGPPSSRRTDILGDLAGYLYISHSSGSGIVILRSPSGDPGTWMQVNVAGMDGDANNYSAVVDSGVTYNGALYVGVTNLSTGVEVWRTAGIAQADDLVDWTQVGGGGLGDPDNGYAELIPFHGELYAWTSNYHTGQQVLRSRCPAASYVVLLVGDGMGANHLVAADLYTANTPAYQSWRKTWSSTFPAGGSYDPVLAWSDFTYSKAGATDSAAAATALYTGEKTANGRIAVSADGSRRLFSLADKARGLGKAVGAATSVYLSHATPGAWYAHNLARANGYAIADEGLWGEPNTTGTPATSAYYGGGLGPTLPPADVLIGAGHPAWKGANYVNWAIRDKLAVKNGMAGAFTFVERVAGSPDGGSRLLAAATDPATTRLAGLFGGTNGNLAYRLADGSGANPEDPTLAQMTQAALTVLARDPDGFVLLIEGGTIDWGAHNNNLDQVIGEVLDLNAAVQAVSDWVDDPVTLADWSNTLVIVTADHETGYLTARPGLFPDQPLGPVNPMTLALEKEVGSTGQRASWIDTDGDNEIDAGEKVYWAWNSGGHTNSLVPVYARGAGAEFLADAAIGYDPVRGGYLDNTDIFRLMDAVTLRPPTPAPPDPPAAPTVSILLSSADVILTWPAVTGATGYEVWRGAAPTLNPGDPGAILVWVPAPESGPGIYTDFNAAGDPEENRTYAVRASGPGGKSAIGARVGLFYFPLMTGEAPAP